ncbi:hypothetical protein EI28_10995 [Methanoculleus sp. MH98A]|nr:hypothetical protein EI28_10995 [Methanoculleus sp. MH98A]
MSTDRCGEGAGGMSPASQRVLRGGEGGLGNLDIAAAVPQDTMNPHTDFQWISRLGEGLTGSVMGGMRPVARAGA